MNLGTFSMSLAVKDIQASKEFYEKLGFEQLEGAGSVEQKWMIMINGSAKLGLFQDMFPTNTLTFYPKDARPILASILEHDLKIAYSNGFDNAEGPCSFSMVDPDGNPILFDQA